MTSFFVASGGGGDVLASAAIHAATSAPGSDAVIATYAWDRLLVDPLPGPRGFDDFTGLDRVASKTHVVTGGTSPVPPAGSTLPRLVSDIAATVMLMDPYGGARGLAEQLAEAVAYFRPERVYVVDVGGDILAKGDEPTLRSPLADTLTLAACANLNLPVHVLVAGLGLDAELEVDYARSRLGTAHEVHTVLQADHVAQLQQTFSWHPSEASAMLAAAARGARGKVEVRDAGTSVRLTADTPQVYRVALDTLMDNSPLAQGMLDSQSLAEVEDVVRGLCGFCEIDYERDKARRLTRTPPQVLTLEEFNAGLALFESQARARGADFVSFRRVAESVGRPEGGYETMRRYMIDRWPQRYVWPIWSLN